MTDETAVISVTAEKAVTVEMVERIVIAVTDVTDKMTMTVETVTVAMFVTDETSATVEKCIGV